MKCLLSIFRLAVLALPILSLAVQAASEQTVLKQAVSSSHQNQKKAQQSQRKINHLADQSRQLLEEYQRVIQQGDYQKAYNEQLQNLEQEQRDEISSLKKQIAEIKITQQRLQPLLDDMTATLTRFIALDIPFQQRQRLESVEILRVLLKSSQTSMAEKFRRVMELYQTENDYNYDIAAYRDVVNVAGKTLSVEMLRIGRSALFYQTLDQQHSSLWQADKQAWLPLDESYNLAVRKAIRVANQESAPHLLLLPQALLSSVSPETAGGTE